MIQRLSIKSPGMEVPWDRWCPFVQYSFRALRGALQNGCPFPLVSQNVSKSYGLPRVTPDNLAFDTRNEAVNLDPWTETFNMNFYFSYLTRWPECCVASSPAIVFGAGSTSLGAHRSALLPFFGWKPNPQL